MRTRKLDFFFFFFFVTFCVEIKISGWSGSQAELLWHELGNLGWSGSQNLAQLLSYELGNPCWSSSQVICNSPSPKDHQLIDILSCLGFPFYASSHGL